MGLIHFNKPYAAPRSFDYMKQALNNAHTCGGGPYTEKCQSFLEQHLGIAKVLLTTSCTDALEMCAILLDVTPGDEIILPSYAFVSTVNAFVMRGGKPVFCDIRPDTLNIDEGQLEKILTPKTKIIIALHYAGVGCEMKYITSLADSNGIHVVEDNAHGLMGRYHGRYLGTFGALATQSFHETKNFNCGEGGALLINDKRFIERADIIREKGTNRSKYLSGSVEKYTWLDIGSSYLPSDMLAAYLYAQFEICEQIQNKRENVWRAYWHGLHDWASAHGVRLPCMPKYCEQPYHMFYMIMPCPDMRDKLMKHMKNRGIITPFHYLPLHLSVMGRSYGWKPGDFPVCEYISERIIRLPFYNEMSDDDINDVIEGVHAFRM